VLDNVREATWYISSLNFCSANQGELLTTTVVVNTDKIEFLADQGGVNIFAGTAEGGLTTKVLKCHIFRHKRRTFPPEKCLRMSLSLVTPEAPIAEGILGGLALL
jgi:hypothetical protein